MKKLLCGLVLIGLLGSACSSADKSTQSLKVVTHDSFAISQNLLDDFRRDEGIDVQLIPSGDAGVALNQAILTKDNPIGDAFFGVDNTFLQRALDAQIFESYAPTALNNVDDKYELDSEHRLVPIDHGEVCVNYDKKYLRDRNLAVPQTLGDLTKPEYKNLLVVENPATSSPGLSFLAATMAEFGDTGWLDYWQRLRNNGVRVTSGWEEAYQTAFSGSSGKGDRPFVVSYATSPPAEVLDIDPLPAEAPTGVMEGSCFQQVEFAGVIAKSSKKDAARKFIDFLLSEKVQNDIPLQMFVFPVNDHAKLPEVFEKFAARPKQVLDIAPSAIAENRDRWIADWQRVVLE